MTDKPRNLRAICFDLDGTLLPMDLDLFMGRYFAALYDFVEARGIEGGPFLDALKAGVRAMAVHEDESTNAEAFWKTFRPSAEKVRGAEGVAWEELLGAFYGGPFADLGFDVKPDPAAKRAVETLAEKGYPLLLTTMPMFPIEAVRHRLRWAGVDPDAFARLTNYENSRAVKPQPIYYAENLAAAGVTGPDVLMVGNNTVEDLSFMRLGADGYLVTDWIIDPVEFDLAQVKHGTLADFAAWCETLPPCSNPAGPIETGAIDPARAEAARAANDAGNPDDASATTWAAKAANDVLARDATANPNPTTTANPTQEN